MERYWGVRKKLLKFSILFAKLIENTDITLILKDRDKLKSSTYKTKFYIPHISHKSKTNIPNNDRFNKSNITCHNQ